jgi:hypothetical protein
MHSTIARATITADHATLDAAARTSTHKIPPASHDLHGRPYATIDDTQPNDILECDGGFTCLQKGELRRVYLSEQGGGLFILCKAGHHWLDGQIDDATHAYVGLYHTKEPTCR